MKRFVLMLAAALSASGQHLDLSSLDGLTAKATEAQNVELDSEKLKLASGLLGQDAGGQAKNLISGMQGVFVRAFEFDKPGQYARSDVDAVRTQLRGPNWKRIVDIKEKDETVELYFYSDNGKMGGMALIASEPRELTIVNIVGSLDMQALGKLMGSMGMSVNVPGLSTSNADARPSGTPRPAPAPRAAPAPKPVPRND